MMLFGRKLTEWTIWNDAPKHERDINWYRAHNDLNANYLFIGINRSHNYREIGNQIWSFNMWGGFPDQANQQNDQLRNLLHDFWREAFNRTYTWDELDQGKQDIDRLITSISELKAFL